MKDFKDYWSFSAIRGVLTMVASAAIWAVPQATSSMLSLPLLIALAIDCFAVYSVFDGAVMILLAKLLPARATARKVLYGQALMGFGTGAFLFLVTFGTVPARWAIWAAAAQAGVAAFCEWKVARDTHAQYGCMSCYSTAIVLAVSAVCLPWASGMDATGMSFALATYVGLYGVSELALGGRMLFVAYRAEHPATVASMAWQAAMWQPAATQALASVPAETALTTAAACMTCPAEALCHDDSPAGQVARVMTQEQPFLVKTLRVVAVLKEAKAPQACLGARRSA